MDVIKIAIPICYLFYTDVFVSFLINKFLKFHMIKCINSLYCYMGNNFELAIAAAIAVFGIHSYKHLWGVIIPLVEVPVLIFTGKRISLWLKEKILLRLNASKKIRSTIFNIECPENKTTFIL